MRHHLHILLYEGADRRDCGPGARAFAQQLARAGGPFIWDRHRDTAPVWAYHNWAYRRWAAGDALVRLGAISPTREAGRPRGYDDRHG